MAPISAKITAPTGEDRAKLRAKNINAFFMGGLLIS
jgi:hypothetical protein